MESFLTALLWLSPIALVTGLIGGILWVIARPLTLGAWWRFRRMPRVPIGQFADGAAGKVAGEVVFFGEPLKAPLSRRACAYYRLDVREWKGGHDGSWCPINEEEDFGDFLLRDETGEARVRMIFAKTWVVRDEHLETGSSIHLDRLFTKLLGGDGGKLSYREGIIEEGERVAVLGVGHWEKHPDDDNKKLLVLESSAKTPLYVTDSPNAF